MIKEFKMSLILHKIQLGQALRMVLKTSISHSGGPGLHSQHVLQSPLPAIAHLGRSEDVSWNRTAVTRGITGCAPSLDRSPSPVTADGNCLSDKITHT